MPPPDLSIKGSIKGSISIPRISVIIPTYNGGKWLEELFSRLENQTLRVDEVLVIDSASSDETVSIAHRHRASVTTISPSKFDHGGTRSMAADLATGDILVFMTQDAIPADINALARLIRPLLANKRIAASYGRQLPSPEANVFSEHLRLFNYPEESYVRCWQDRHKYGFNTVFISNSFAAYQKQVLEQHGFFPDKLLFGEDTCTVAKLLESGYCVAYESEARVFHSHNYSIAEDFRRYFDIGVFHACRHEMLEKFGTPTNAGKRFVCSEISFLLRKKQYYRLPESVLRNLAKFIAYNTGKRYKALPHGFAKKLSMHRRWWS